MDSCAWVTHCLGEDDVEKALVLGRSLRRVLTRNRLVAIVYPDISPEWGTKLEAIFDLVVPVTGWNSNSLSDLLPKDSFALSFALTFNFFGRCIFLSPGTLVLKNCDDLFEAHRAEEEQGSTGWGYEAGTPIYFKPCRDAFTKLTEILIEDNDVVASDANFLTYIMKNKSVDFFVPLGGPYFSVVDLDEKQPLKRNGSLEVVHLKNLPNNLGVHDLENGGLLEKHVYNYWLELRGDGNVQSIGSWMMMNEPIAIVGMSCRLPASNTVDEFWDLLVEGADGISIPPEDRFPKEHFPNFDRNNTQAGFLSVPVNEFDAKFFGISPKEVMYMDPQIRLLHEVVWEGLEDAGVNPANLKGTPAGVFLGSYQNEYVTILQNSEDNEDFRTWMGNSISVGAARISHLLGLTGPSVGTNPACAASLAALHMAVQSLRQGECNMGITCAVNLILLPFTHDTPGLDAITSPDGHCKTFDASADGFGRAEGCTVLILKKQSDAVRDGDNILGLIRGTAIAQEGLSRSIGTPTAKCEARVMTNALRDGNVNPVEISYIEAHGTGTVVGDTTEIHAISKVYGGVNREEPLVIGSVKTNIGHTEACSGIAGIMKVILSMKNELIPQHRNFKELNPNINLEVIPARLPLQPIAWPKSSKKLRMAGVNSFGFTGMDGHAVIQEADETFPSKQRTTFPEFERPLHIMKFTAKTEEALRSLLEGYKVSLGSAGSQKFTDMAYTSNVGRSTFPYRAALVASDNIGAKILLDSGKIINNHSGSFGGDASNICFLFTGQGSQYHGMAKQLYSTSPIFHSNFDYCDNFLKSKYNISIKEVFFGPQESSQAHRTIYSQTGIFVVEYCLLKLWECWGIRPNVVLGHSLGEFCAAVAAGILDLDEALTLVAERSSLIENLQHGKMLVVKLDKSGTEEQVDIFKTLMCQRKDVCLDFAAINTPEQTVLAGDSEAILEFKEFLKNNGGIKCSLLHSTHAFHSRHMDPMLEEYRLIAEKDTGPRLGNECIYISGMMGKVLDVTEVNGDYWVRHTRENVNFLQASKVAYDELGCRIFLEIGPNPVLSTMMMMNNNCDTNTSLLLPSLRRNGPDWETMLSSLGKLFVHGSADVDWEGFDQFYQRSKVPHLLPTYPFKKSKFWPKIPSPRNTEIHPLLGFPISNPTPSRMFQCELKLNKLEYLKDHMIGDGIVFPGAGYMEMLLMAGHAAMEGLTSTSALPTRPIAINKFKISAALGLQEDSSVSCQTIVQQAAEDGEGFPVEMFHEVINGEDSNWIRHAHATFSPFLHSPEEWDVFHPHRDLANIQRIKGSHQAHPFAPDLYENVKQLGLNFGLTFRTLARLWRAPNTNEVLAEVETPKDSAKYLLHPTLIDAMIQMAIFHERNIFEEGNPSHKLYVPTGCDRFIWFSPLKTKLCYVHANCDAPSPILLFDGEGTLVAALLGVTSVESRVSTIKALLETQVKSRPDFFTVEWMPTLGPFQNRIDFDIVPDPVQLIRMEPMDISDYSEAGMILQRDENNLIACYITNALQGLGWSPKLNDRVCLEEIATELKIVPEQRQLLGQFLIFLEEDGILERSGDKEWIVREYMIPLSVADKLVGKYLQQAENPNREVILLLECIGSNLGEILSGRKPPLEILFPECDSAPSVAKFYTCFSKVYMNVLARVWSTQLGGIKKSCRENHLPLPHLKILEVGAGTGAVSGIFLGALDEAGLPFEYVYTDISTSFFHAAEDRFEKYKSSMKFKRLNLEQDPISQGFPPNYFDVVIGAQVVHATRDIRESLLNIKQLLRAGGSLWLTEMLGSDRIVDYVFGLTEGFWRFTDLELRRDHPMLTGNQWEYVLNDMGFSQVGYTHYNKIGLIISRADAVAHQMVRAKFNPKMQMCLQDAERCWLVFCLEEEMAFMEKIGEQLGGLERRKLIFVKHKFTGSFTKRLDNQYEINPDNKEDMTRLFESAFNPKDRDHPPVEGIIVTWGITGSTGRDQRGFAKPFLHLLQNLIHLPVKPLPRLVLLTSGQHPVGDICCGNPSTSALLGIAQTALNEHPEVKLKGIDLDPQQLDLGLVGLLHEMFSSLEDDDPSYLTAYRGNVRYVPRFSPDKLLQNERSLTLPFGTTRYLLNHSPAKTFQGLQFGPLEQYSLGPNDIEVGVKCTALNFKDVISVLKPSPEFKTYNTIGLDFSGVVTRVGVDAKKWKVGDPICGYRVEGNTFPSHLQVHEDLVTDVAPNWSFTEAASLQAVFATAYHSLVNVAKVREGETVLLHTASGGVGLVAIQIAQQLRLNIICTVGSQRKEAYLRSIGIQHVLHSRNTHYEKAILQETKGKGVHVVLNSLTGAGFKEATLGACAHGARFVEMSRLNIWTEEEVRERRPDVDYTIVDITTLDHATHHELTFTLRQWIREGKLKPIPYTRFDAVDVGQALNFLQKARHVGKVVCTFPSIDQGSLAKEGRSQLFNNQSTYLITGGLGGIGLEVCKYMLGQGARHIVLLGRKTPNSKTAALLKSLKMKWDCDIQVMQGDIGEFSECLAIFTKIADSLPPLRGVMHVAGTLSDDLLKNLTWDKFQFTYQAKVNGSWNLHELTKNLILEHFVLFSSFASTLGSPGQANYTSACQFQDGLAHFRNTLGLPATTINWGQFGEVGLAAGANLPLVREFSPQQGMNALDEILRKNRNHVTPVTFNSSADFHINMFPLTKWLFGDHLQKLFGKGKLSPAGTGGKVDHTQFSKDYDSCQNAGEKIGVMKTTLKDALIHVLRLNTEEAVDVNMDFDEMGMDSLMMIEFQNFLQDILKGRVTLVQSAWSDCTNVNTLGKRLVELMEGDSEDSSKAPPTLEDVRDLILKDAVLPEGLQVDNPGSEVRPSQIKTVLLTGSTGFMGSHLLIELLESCPQLEKIHCLVRRRQKISPEERLLSTLEKNGIPFNRNQFDKLVSPVIGNLTEPHFGLPEESYLKLAEEVDAVIHFGAQVNQTEYYKDIPGGKTGARSVNVGGLLNVLEFGCRTKTKHIFNASTLAALLQPVEGDHFTEEWPDISELAVATTSGYFASQYVCDALLKEATTHRGLPCKSFRYSRAMGDVVMESSLSDQSLFTKLLIFSLKEKVMPEKPIPVNIIPVGIAVKITIKIIFSDEAPNEIYNVFHPRPHLLQECLEIIANEMGASMTRIDHFEGRDKYIKILQQRKEPNSQEATEILAEFENFFSDDNLFSFFSYANVLAERFVNNRDFFVSGKLSRFVPELYCEMQSSLGILKRYMDKVMEEGLM